MSTTQTPRPAAKPAAKKVAPPAKKTAAAAPAAEGEEPEVRRHRELVGVVVSNKMDKTLVVQVVRRYKHPKYKKYVNERQRYKAHDEKNTANIGDRVIIVESRPLSKDKRWRLQTVVERAEAV
jgi:small subunit ribosomal protein S17